MARGSKSWNRCQSNFDRRRFLSLAPFFEKNPPRFQRRWRLLYAFGKQGRNSVEKMNRFDGSGRNVCPDGWILAIGSPTGDIWNAKYTLSGLSDRKDRPTGRRKRKKERREGEKKKNAITRRDIAGRSQPVTTDGYIKATVEKSVQRLHACILLYPRYGGGRRYIRLLPGRRRRWRRRNEPVALKEEGISGLARREGGRKRRCQAGNNPIWPCKSPARCNEAANRN